MEKATAGEPGTVALASEGACAPKAVYARRLRDRIRAAPHAMRTAATKDISAMPAAPVFGRSLRLFALATVTRPALASALASKDTRRDAPRSVTAIFAALLPSSRVALTLKEGSSRPM